MTPNDPRQAAVRRLSAQRDFRRHLGVYVLVNTMLVIIWALTDASFFWPVWPIVGWGIGLALHGVGVYADRPISEDAIQLEMDRQESRHGLPR